MLGGGKCYRTFSLKKTNENEEWGDIILDKMERLD